MNSQLMFYESVTPGWALVWAERPGQLAGHQELTNNNPVTHDVDLQVVGHHHRRLRLRRLK
jgi:hypothetical protein